MRPLFWISVAILAYTYAGYAAWLWLRARRRTLPVQSADYTPSVSIVIIVRNEESVLASKLNNLTSLDYPPELLEIVVASDGSNDGTNEILSQYSSEYGVRAILKPDSQGKAAGLNDALAAANGDLIVFTDARQKIEAPAVRMLARNFADPAIGCVSGELMLGEPDSGESTQRMGLYWKIEKKIRELESASGSVVGATGALYAVRRSLLTPVPSGTILDDVFIPMNVVRQGKRVIFEPKARAWDLADQGTREFHRKVRTLSGNYQLLQIAPWLLSRENPLLFEFVSHKLLRLFAPFGLVTALVTSLLIPEPIYRIALGLQLGLYALSVVSMTRLVRGPLGRIADAAYTFVALNTAAVVAFVRFIIGRKLAWGG